MNQKHVRGDVSHVVSSIILHGLLPKVRRLSTTAKEVPVMTHPHEKRFLFHLVCFCAPVSYRGIKIYSDGVLHGACQ